MKLLSIVLAYVLLIQGALAQTIINTDQVSIGKKGSSSNTVLKLKKSGGTVDLEVDNSTGDLNVTSSNLKLGKGVNEDASIKFDRAGNDPYLKWDETKQKWVFSNDSVIEKAIGSGAGGGTGQTFNENGNLEDGISVSHSFTPGVATALSGENALEGEVSVELNFASENDFYQSSYFTLPPGLYGMACEMRFKYVGGDANTYVVVETESGVTLGRYQRPESGSIVYGLIPHTEAGYESVFFKCPTQADITADPDNGKIRYRLYQGTSIDAAPLTADLFSMGELIGLTETTLPDTFVARIAGDGTVSEENLDWINGNASIVSTATYNISFNSGVFSVPPICMITYVAATDSTGRFAYERVEATSSGVSFRILNSGEVATATAFKISCQKTGADAKQSVQVYKSIPKVSENVNVFSARVSAAGVVSGTNTDWITSQSGTPPSYQLNFKPGLFTSVPNCTITTNGASGAVVKINTITTTYVAMFSFISNTSTGHSQDFHIICQRGSDYVMPTVQPIVIGQVTNSAAESALNNVRVESCLVNNNGSATIDTQSGLCEGWVQSVSSQGAGLVSINIKAGIFSSIPNCNATTYFNTGTFATSIYSIGKSQVAATTTLSNSSTGVNRPVMFTCTGKR